MNIHELDYACIHCRGSGVIDDVPCKSCEGWGYDLSYEGRKLVEFLQRRGVAFPMSPLAEDELRRMVE